MDILKDKKFKNSKDLTKWVNKELHTSRILSITSNGKYEGEGYTLFYIDTQK